MAINDGSDCLKDLDECLSLYRGDAVSFDLTLELDGLPVNLNDYTVFFTVKKRLTDPDSKAVILKDSEHPSTGNSGGINILSSSEGKARVVLLHSDTKDLLEGSHYYGVSVVREGDEIILSTDKGSIMRCSVNDIRIGGRNTQGVRIKKLSGNEKVVSVIKIEDNIH